jgi:hypothetical protein
MPKATLREYNQWFLAVIPERVQVLANAVKSTAGFDDWNPDHTPKSLLSLGLWLSQNVETRPRTAKEIKEIESSSRFDFGPPPSEELTDKTFSIAMDVGMYLATVFLHAHSSLRWRQNLTSKSYIEYGQPALIGFGQSDFNPVRMTLVVCYGIARGAKGEGRLKELYDYWSRLVSNEDHAKNTPSM